MKRRRPAGIWIIVALQIALAITLLPGVAETFPAASPIEGIAATDLWRQVYIGWAVINVLAALWLWTLSRRGWALVMVLVGIGLVANLYLWFLGQPAFVRMAIQAATALYLNSSLVRGLFQRDEEDQRIKLRESEPA
jgi:hypothetical protein